MLFRLQRLVIIDHFDRFRAGLRPAKTDPILVIDADTMLAASITIQGLKAVSGRNAEIGEGLSRVELIEFALSDSPQILRQFSTSQATGDTVKDSVDQTPSSS